MLWKDNLLTYGSVFFVQVDFPLIVLNLKILLESLVQSRTFQVLVRDKNSSVQVGDLNLNK